MKYETLLRVLDGICQEAPVEFKSYHPKPSDTEKVCQARAKAFIHLYLKVKFGISTFKERHDLVCDGSYDGGLDAYYIDTEKKRLYLIQSKFRMTEKNFEEKSITADDLVRMDIKRILDGEDTDSNGKKFHSKIKTFQNKWASIRDQAKYEYVVLFLGNLRKYSDAQVKRLIENSKYEVFDYERTYKELLFALCSGTYYNPQEVEIKINLADKTKPILEQTVITKYGEYDIAMLYVPVSEIGRVVAKYQNAILEYNPRNFLELSKNTVNQKIYKSAIACTGNEFALLNNGITMISHSFESTKRTGVKGVGQIILDRPQIINGGQTAHTLSRVYESEQPKSLEGKEVLLKVVVVSDHNLLANRQFIEEISNATNEQTKVSEADRRSNHPVQVKLQQKLFQKYGLFYERKRGEFHTGHAEGYINRENVIERVSLAKAFLALKGNPTEARRYGADTLFTEDRFKKTFGEGKNYSTMLFAYLVLRHLRKLSRTRRFGMWERHSLRYGKMAIIAAVGKKGFSKKSTLSEMEAEVSKKLKKLEPKWRRFEAWMKKRRVNKDYVEDGAFNFDNYYKGKTINEDVRKYFAKR